MSVKKKNKGTTEISISEFKQWLSGVEDMQPTGWVPDEAQWKKIRAKIDALSEALYEDAIASQPVHPAPQPYPQPVIRPYQPDPSYTALPYTPGMQTGAPRTQMSLGDEIFIPRADPSELAGMNPMGGNLGPMHNDDQFS